MSPESKVMASQTIRGGIGIDCSGFGTRALLRCVDVLTMDSEPL